MKIDPDAIRRETSAAGGRYVYDLADGSQAELRYFEQPEGIVTIHHTETPVAHRGQGIAAQIVAHAVGDLGARGKRIVPACPFVYQQFRMHPEWANLLARR